MGFEQLGPNGIEINLDEGDDSIPIEKVIRDLFQPINNPFVMSASKFRKRFASLWISCGAKIQPILILETHESTAVTFLYTGLYAFRRLP
jgi:hypothetical protein